MFSKIDSVLLRFANSKAANDEKLLSCLYHAMGDTKDKRNKACQLAEYLYFKFKQKKLDNAEQLKPVLRSALKELLQICDDEIQLRVQVLQSIPDAYIPENDAQTWNTQLDELISERINGVIGPVGIANIAILNFNHQHKPASFPNNKAPQEAARRAVQLKVNQLQKQLCKLREQPPKDPELLTSVKQAVRLLVDKDASFDPDPLKHPFRNALSHLEGYYELQHHQHQQLVLRTP